MSIDNRIKAFNLLQETLFAFEEMSSEKRWLTVAVDEGDADYMKRVNDDLRDAIDNFKRLKDDMLTIMERGLDSEITEEMIGGKDEK